MPSVVASLTSARSCSSPPSSTTTPIASRPAAASNADADADHSCLADLCLIMLFASSRATAPIARRPAVDADVNRHRALPAHALRLQAAPGLLSLVILLLLPMPMPIVVASLTSAHSSSSPRSRAAAPIASRPATAAAADADADRRCLADHCPLVLLASKQHHGSYR
jgi:hypothetical protein